MFIPSMCFLFPNIYFQQHSCFELVKRVNVEQLEKYA